MSKFKVGDKVKILDGSKIDDYFGGWIDGMKSYVGRVCTIESISAKRHSKTTGYHMKETSYVWDERALELAEDKSKFKVGDMVVAKKNNGYGVTTDEKIVITHDGKTTTARLFDGKKVMKIANTRCNPVDEFDFNTGATIAFERLMDQTESTVEEAVDVSELFKVLVDFSKALEKLLND